MELLQLLIAVFSFILNAHSCESNKAKNLSLGSFFSSFDLVLNTILVHEVSLFCVALT